MPLQGYSKHFGISYNHFIEKFEEGYLYKCKDAVQIIPDVLLHDGNNHTQLFKQELK